MPISENDLRQAVAWHEAGQLEKAEKVYQAFLKLQPKDARVLAMLGVLKLQQGQAQEATRFLQRASEADPGRLDILTRLASAQVAAADFEGAASSYRRLLEQDSRSLDALAGLTHSLTELRQFDEALTYCHELVESHPGLVAALESLTSLQFVTGNQSAAIETANRIQSQQPNNLAAHLVMARIELGKGDHQAARTRLESRFSNQPNSPDALELLAQCHAQARDFKATLKYTDQALKIDANHEASLLTKASALQSLGRIDEARTLLDHAIKCHPRSAPVSYAMARVLEDCGEMESAEAGYRKAMLLGDDGHPEILESLVRFHRYSEPGHPDEREIRELLSRSGLPSTQRMRLHFALGKVLDDQGKFAEAFEHFDSANKLLQEQRPYDAQTTSAFTQALISTFDPALRERLMGWGSQSEIPVLVVGMPRSGTSLVEQVLASHPEIFGAGELRAAVDLMGRAQDLSAGKSYPGCLSNLDQSGCDELAGVYLDALKANAPESALRICDKRPGNVFHLGMLLSLFPRAVAVYCTRDVRDLALSNYFQHFTEGHAFSSDIDDVVSHHCYQAQVMDHWQGLFGNRIFTLKYERLVADFEPNARELLAHTGLEWSDQCLEFYRVKRPVQTASAHQVRQPVYSRSVGRWRSYRDFLPETLLNRPVR